MTDLVPAALAHPPPGVDATLARVQRQSDSEVAGKEFEALMIRELLSAMRSTIPENDDSGSPFARNTLFAMLDERLADATAGHLGLSDAFASQFGGASATSLPGFASGPRLPAPPPTDRDAVPTAGAGVLAGGLPRAGESPVDGVVSSPFGWRTHPVEGTRKFHAGLDLAAPTGTGIRAADAGTVTYAGRQRGYGLTVELRHADGTVTRYAHASRIHVRQGDRVEVGEAIADVGSTGQSTGPHLHFEVRRNGRAVDPEQHLSELRSRSASPATAARTGVRMIKAYQE